MGKDSGGDTQTVTQSNTPFNEGQWRTLYNRAFGGNGIQGLYQPGGQYGGQFGNYPSFATSAPASQATQSGVQGLLALGQNNPVTQQSVSALGDTLSGQYLDPSTNPHLQSVIDTVGDKAMGAVNSTFGGAGRTGSEVHQQSVAEGVGQATAPYLFGQYNNERENMLKAQALAPGVNQMQMGDIQSLLQSGGITEGYQQNRINDQLGRFLGPQNSLMSQAQLLAGTSGFGTQTGTQPVYGNPYLSGITGGLGLLSGVNDLTGDRLGNSIGNWLFG